MAGEAYRISLENIFEGPMDLLVHLIRKNEVDVYDIPISLITDQYIQYLELLKSMNVDLAGDFILMAATLMQIKSKMLLPVHDDMEAEEDPRMELVQPLMEYLQFKTAAEMLSQRHLLGKDTFTRKPSSEAFSMEAEDGFVRVSLFELIDAFQKVLDKIGKDHCVDMSEESISIKEKITELAARFETKTSMTFSELFPERVGKAEVIVTFLAILEMVKLSLLRITQHSDTGTIRLFYQ